MWHCDKAKDALKGRIDQLFYFEAAQKHVVCALSHLAVTPGSWNMRARARTASYAAALRLARARFAAWRSCPPRVRMYARAPYRI